MHPAYSVIFFTTASGAGYGLLLLLGLGAVPEPLAGDRWFGAAAFALAFALVTFGLLASTFHLGHPERAWRAFSQWRTSWLSREGIVSVATYVPAGLFALGWVVLGAGGGADGGVTDGVWPWLGLASALLAAATVYCTAMIYASLAAIPRWNEPLVVPVYLLFALASGAMLLACLCAAFGAAPGGTAWLAAGSTGAAWALKLAYWRRIDTAPPRHTAGSATGLGGPGAVHLFEAPNTSENYLQREMGYRIARKHARRLRIVALVLGGIVPAVLAALAGSVAGWPALAILLPAVASMGAGLLVERWLFFAEARHVVMLYYGEEAA